MQRQICKPGSVPFVSIKSLQRASIINLALSLLIGSNNLPILTLTPQRYKTGASSSTFRTYLVFQLLRFTAISVARKSRELLPHVFTLICPYEPTVYFLWHFLSPAVWRLPVRKQDALCCPDFPLPTKSKK